MPELSRVPYSLAQPAITIAGQAQPDLDAVIDAVSVEETAEGLYRCEVRLVNWGSTPSGINYPYFDRKLLDFGTRIEVTMGAGDGRARLFTGRISAMEGHFPGGGLPPLLTVLAEDRLFDLRMVRRTRSFEQVSDSDLFQQIASDHGLTPNVDVTGPSAYRVITQVNQTDLAFLRERARAIDADLWVDGDTLHAQARSRRSGTDLTLNYTDELNEFEVLADLASQRTSLTVSGWDVAAKEAIAEEATKGALGSELGSLKSGAETLSAAFADRAESIVTRGPITSDEAKSQAESAYRRMARQFVTGAGLTRGDARIRVGVQLTLKGIGPLFEGSYYVTETRHTYGQNGYTTRFRVERAGIGA